MTTTHKIAIIFAVLFSILFFGCAPKWEDANPITPVETQQSTIVMTPIENQVVTIAVTPVENREGAIPITSVENQEDTNPIIPVDKLSEKSTTVNVEFTLRTIAQNGKLLYIGVGGDINDVINPDLVVHAGALVHVTLIDGDGMTHNFFLPDFDLKTDYVRRIGDQADITLATGDIQPGSYVYYCTLPGHRKAGQEGKLIIVEN